jgi:hypothetical protein
MSTFRFVLDIIDHLCNEYAECGYYHQIALVKVYEIITATCFDC